MQQRAIFLDRDGVLCRSLVRDGKGYAPRSLAEFAIYPEAPTAVGLLKAAGFQIVVVTNQPDIGHGLVTEVCVASMHQRLQAAMPIDLILTCPHRQEEGCGCRKPRPGLLEEAVRRLSIDAGRSFMVGDRSSDVVAGQALGCVTLFIDRHYREPLTVVPDGRVASVWHAAQWIVARCSFASSRPPPFL
ncbi:MAG: HAD-IIIA family hydrolase [Magnetococcus sp. MYC-9]